MAATCALFVAMVGSAAPRPDGCDDFLRAAGKKPPSLEFVECQPEQISQLAALVATYRVRGVDAHRVERELMRRTGMPGLRFMCCYWGSRSRAGQHSGMVHAANGISYEVRMNSGETLVNRRANWKQIAWFYVSVTHYLEEP